MKQASQDAVLLGQMERIPGGRMYLGTRTPPDIGGRKSGRILPKPSSSTNPLQDYLSRWFSFAPTSIEGRKGFLPEAETKERNTEKSRMDS